MVNFDLRDLSAPLESLRPEVDAAYKRLDDKWNAIAEQLRKLPIPCNVGYTFDVNPHDPEQYRRLEWCKSKGKRRIWIVLYSLESTPDGPSYAETATPYDEWSAEERVNMLQHVPKLFEAAVEQTKAFIAKIQE